MNEPSQRGGVLALLRTTAQEFRDDECPSMAAALAYYTALAMPPLLVMIVSVAGWIWGPEDVHGTRAHGRRTGQGETAANSGDWSRSRVSV